MPATKSSSKTGIRAQSRWVPIKRCLHHCGRLRSQLSLSCETVWRRRPHIEPKTRITELFKQFHERYGYKRITNELKKLGYVVNHKKVYRLMQALGLKCVKFMRKSRRYNSYKGNVGKVAKNRLSRQFNTSVPLQKLVIDIMIISRVEAHQYAIGVHRFMTKSPSDNFSNTQFRSTHSHKESTQVFFRYI